MLLHLLDNPNHAVEFILSAFAPSKREELKILAELYVSQLKGSSKNLADIFYKKVISSRRLSTPDRRNLWIANWELRLDGKAFRYDLGMTLSDPCSMIPRDRLGNLLFREYLVYPGAAFQLFCLTLPAAPSH